MDDSTILQLQIISGEHLCCLSFYIAHFKMGGEKECYLVNLMLFHLKMEDDACAIHNTTMFT